MLDLFRKDQSLEQVEKEFADAQKDISGACQAATEYEAETRIILGDRKRKTAALRQKSVQLEAHSRQLQKRLEGFNSLKIRHPGILQPDPVDLDQYTLISSENVLFIDESAPVLYVDFEIWAHENTRRNRITDLARTTVESEWNAKKESWRNSFIRTVMGVMVPPEDRKVPEFEYPTWTMILKRKWNLTLIPN